MKEELVNFDIAVLAKEKGFNATIDTAYSNEGHGPYHDSICFNKEAYTLAPTQSLLQKWLREVHNIDIIIEPNQDSNGNKYYCWRGRQNMFSSTIGNVANYYEEALEQGLQEGLKLIKK